MHVYHFINAKYGLENLQRRRLKIATIDNLNDPFELLPLSSKVQAVRQAFLQHKDQMAAKFGMLCFSRSWENPVQWSHYADGHRGICLGFNVPKDNLVTVTYSAKRREPNLPALTGGSTTAQANMMRILSTKHSHWRYENEERCFTDLRDKDDETSLYFAPFSQTLALKEVIIGHCATITRTELKLALGEPASDVSVCKARLAFRSFRVVRQRNEKLWQ